MDHRPQPAQIIWVYSDIRVFYLYSDIWSTWSPKTWLRCSDQNFETTFIIQASCNALFAGAPSNFCLRGTTIPTSEFKSGGGGGLRGDRSSNPLSARRRKRRRLISSLQTFQSADGSLTMGARRVTQEQPHRYATEQDLNGSFKVATLPMSDHSSSKLHQSDRYAWHNYFEIELACTCILQNCKSVTFLCQRLYLFSLW